MHSIHVRPVCLQFSLGEKASGAGAISNANYSSVPRSSTRDPGREASTGKEAQAA